MNIYTYVNNTMYICYYNKPYFGENNWFLKSYTKWLPLKHLYDSNAKMSSPYNFRTFIFTLYL